MNAQKILAGLIAFFLIATTIMSLAYADHTIELTSEWTSTDGTSVSVDQGDDAQVLVYVTSTIDFGLWIEILRGSTLVRTAFADSSIPIGIGDSYIQEFPLDTSDLGGDYVVRVHVQNSEGDDTQMLNLHVATQPTIESIEDMEMDENGFLAFAVFVNDLDGDPLTIEARSCVNLFGVCIATGPLPVEATFMQISDRRGAFVFRPGYDFVTHPDQQEIQGIKFRATDGSSSSNWERILITVNDVNRLPAFTSDPLTSAQEGSPYTYVVTATDADAEDSLSYSLISYPKGMSFNSRTGAITWTPGYTQMGEHEVIVQVTDGIDSVNQEFTITVDNTNRVPVLAPIGDRMVSENEELTFIVSASDPDGDTLSFNTTQLPAGATFDPASHTFTWIPSFTQAGSYDVTFEVTDGSLADEETITITVQEVVLSEVCGDGVDNDGDGFVDESCTQCADGIDNDGDGLTDLFDPGCSDAADDDESDIILPPEVCGDGLDNDGDGLIDEGCVASTEICGDGVDNDGDGLVDEGCAQCADGVDNDGDGFVDMLDPGCSSPIDADETDVFTPAQCADGIDNDGDELTDLFDPGCSNLLDNDETNDAPCVDSDADGLCDNVDEIILGCTNPAAVNYRPQADLDDGGCMFGEMSDVLELTRVSLSSENVLPADILFMSIHVANEGELDVEDLQVSVLIYDLGIFQSTTKFDLDEGEQASRGLALQLPEDAPAGDYLIKVTVGNREHRESAYRLIRVS